MRIVSLSCLSALLLVVACGDESDPFAPGDDDAPTADAAPGGDDTPDAAPDDEEPADAGPKRKCAPAPKRLIVLGDSITECSVTGGKNDPGCVSKLFHAEVEKRFPGVSYENYAVGGAVTSGVKSQIGNIPSKPGHALVVLYIGGNDLAPYIFQSDQAAQQAWDGPIRDAILANWPAFYTSFADTSKFPDGVTVILNTQYNPFDDCTAPPYNLSMLKSDILHAYNATLVDIANEHFDNTIIVDQYKPYLGHGHHYNVASCPHYKANQAPYMKDLIHANAEGNKQLAAVLASGLPRLYDDCTP